MSQSPITGLDHVVILVRDLAAATRAYEILLGRAPSWRAEGTVLFTLANMSVELVAPAGEHAARVAAALEHQGEGLAALAFRVGDIAKMHRRLSRLDLAPEEIGGASSRDAASGNTLAWKRTRAATAKTHGVRLFFLERSDEPPDSAEGAVGCVTGLDHAVIQTPAPERAAALYGARLGLDMALDRTNVAWGSRLMFFRCGDLVIEIMHQLGKAGDGPDNLWGLSWRVADADAAQARITAAGLEVSAVRTGRKPGTRVFTVKSGTCGVPTLMVQPARL